MRDILQGIREDLRAAIERAEGVEERVRVLEAKAVQYDLLAAELVEPTRLLLKEYHAKRLWWAVVQHTLTAASSVAIVLGVLLGTGRL